MADIISMPKLSDTMTVGTLVRWLKNEGDAVASGDMLAEVETDKATMEVENFTPGVLLKQYVTSGQSVPIGQAICAVGKKGEEIPEVAVHEAPGTDGESETINPTNYVPDVASSEVTPPPVAPVASSGNRIKASPLARKIALDKQVNLANIAGSGPNGRIVKADVLSAKPSKRCMTNSNLFQEKVTPVSGMRSTIARRLLESTTTTPHFYLSVTIGATALENFRADVLEFFGDADLRITLNDCILAATAKALTRVPAMNASWEGTQIRQHGTVDLAFGVALEDGLVTPVIRGAHKLSLVEISSHTKELIAKARAKGLRPEEMAGSTFTVTNLGMYGIDAFYGIINPPNAGILSVGGIFKAPIVNHNDEIVVGKRMTIGLSADHRVVDGAAGAQFLGELKKLLEKPALMLI
jgi:pyruvate dehydrogenase E2 component (dihydrolipoamide acetyltransferase)